MIHDADLSFLLARYGRVSPAEYAVFTLVWRATEGCGRMWARISPAVATEDAAAIGDYLGIHPDAARRTLRVLYADGRRIGNRPSHNLLHRRTDGHLIPRYTVNTTWRNWGWLGVVDFEAIDRDRRRLVGPLPPGSWSVTAEALASDLAERLRSSGAETPPLDLGDITFRRWCRTIQRLLDEAGDEAVRAVLVFAATEPYWLHRVAGFEADRNIAAVFYILQQFLKQRAT